MKLLREKKVQNSRIDYIHETCEATGYKNKNKMKL